MGCCKIDAGGTKEESKEMFLKLIAIIIDNKGNASHQNNNNFEKYIGTEVVNCNQLNDHIKKVKEAF